jgi:hypothetical protein
VTPKSRWFLITLGACVVLVALLLTASRTYGGTSFTFECADPSSSAPTVLCDAYLDPDVHHGSLGTVLFHATTTGKRTITLDIPTGSHKVTVRAGSAASGGTNTSVLVMSIPSTCPTGWATLGYQSWWSDTGQDPAFQSRHEHWDGLCVPSQPVDGLVTFTPTIQLHNQPAGAKFYRYRVTDCKPGGSCGDIFVRTTNLPQPDANGNLVLPVSIPIDFSKLTTGRHELRFGIYVRQPNGKVQLLSSRTEIGVRSFSPSYRSLSSFPILQGNGAWYEKDGNPGYVDARIRSALVVAP